MKLMGQQLYALAILLDYAKSQHWFWEYWFCFPKFSLTKHVIRLAGLCQSSGWKVVYLSNKHFSHYEFSLCNHISFPLNCLLRLLVLQRVKQKLHHYHHYYYLASLQWTSSHPLAATAFKASPSAEVRCSDRDRDSSFLLGRNLIIMDIREEMSS